MSSKKGPATSKIDNRHIITTENKNSGVCEVVLKFLSLVLIIITFPISIFLCFIIVREYERIVIFRLGRLRKGIARGPGLISVIPCIDAYYKVDLRTFSFDVPPQEILTKDSVTIGLDAVVYYRLEDPLKAVIQIIDYNGSTQLLAQTTLRNVAGTKTLIEILVQRVEISHMIQRILDIATDPWGIKVERVEIKDILLPRSLQRAMAAEAEATREAKAKFVSAEGELIASKTLKIASDVLGQNPISLQLRYLQTLSSISSERNRNIIFPFPMELLSRFRRVSTPESGESADNKVIPLPVHDQASGSFYSCKDGDLNLSCPIKRNNLEIV